MDRRLAAALAADVAFVGGGMGATSLDPGDHLSQGLCAVGLAFVGNHDDVLCMACLGPQSGRLAIRSPVQWRLTAAVCFPRCGRTDACSPDASPSGACEASRTRNIRRPNRWKRSGPRLRPRQAQRPTPMPRRACKERGKNERRAQKFEASHAILLLLERSYSFRWRGQGKCRRSLDPKLRRPNRSPQMLHCAHARCGHR
jgi:hypothetical protein